MVSLASDVRLGLVPEMVLALLTAERLYTQAGAECVITSGTEGAHHPGSRHYEGRAVDLRTRHVAPDLLPKLLAALTAALGPAFYAQLETASTPGATGPHLHLEYRGPVRSNSPGS